MFLPHPRVKVSIVSIVGSLRDREVACSASDRQGSNFESCVWRTVSSQSSHHPQEVLLAQFSLYVHKGGLKPDSFHFISTAEWLFFARINDFYVVLIVLWINRGGSRKKSDSVPTINNYTQIHVGLYINGNFLRDLNICEFLILVLFVKSTIFNIWPNRYSHWVVECNLFNGA